MTKLETPASGTRERIMSAAFTLFGRYGFKRTSMEDIAIEAGLSRTALYLQFRNKEDIFRELARGLHEAGLSGAEAALEGDGSFAHRLRAAVEAKTLRMIEVVQASPHGNELMDEKNRLCGDLATDSERGFQEMLTRAFERADRQGEIDLAGSGLNAAEAADLFAHATFGLKDLEGSKDAYRRRLESLTRVFVSGIGPTGTRARDAS
jgi:AcrR family transcriptional regulator